MLAFAHVMPIARKKRDHMNEISDHLGGYIPGGDPATQFPDLWRWIIREEGVRSVLDVGCGEGQAVDFFEEEIRSQHGSGLILGIDGVPQDHPGIITHDFVDRAFIPSGRYDMIWSCEFVEHVEERFVPNFLETFSYGDLILMTHGEPGQAGHHHVNNQNWEYWMGAMASIGYFLDRELTRKTRELASLNDNQWNHYRRSGMAFRRYS